MGDEVSGLYRGSFCINLLHFTNFTPLLDNYCSLPRRMSTNNKHTVHKYLVSDLFPSRSQPRS